jgi:Predicted metal-dependent hydrolase with the TIM-barrel fold
MVIADDAADTILVGGRVYTVDRRNSVHNAIAIRAGKVQAVGSDAEIKSLVSRRTKVISIAGGCVVPGLIDSHCHLLNLGSLPKMFDCKAPDMTSIAAIVDAVRREAERLPAGTWIRGRGYDQSRLAERRHPVRSDLDPVSPEHPVILTRTCGHIAAFNSRAMAESGLNDETPNPPMGWYDRDEGRLSGVAYELAQRPLQEAASFSRDEKREALLRAQALYLAAGCTSVHDAGGLMGVGFSEARRLDEEGRLVVRIYAFGEVGSTEQVGLSLLKTEITTGFGTPRLRVGAFKVVSDGSSSGPTCATREPYASDSTSRGLLYWDQDELERMILAAHKAGYQVTMHAVGDRANEAALMALDRCARVAPRPGTRHRIEHCAMLPDDLLAFAEATGVLAVVQPAFIWEFGDGYITNFGVERAASMFRARSLASRGIVVAGSSDAPVSDYRPLFGIQEALKRVTRDGRECGPQERVDLAAALRMYTINGAYGSFEDDAKGSLEPGKVADLVLLGHDIGSVSADEIAGIPVLMTMVDGHAVYESGGVPV